MMRWIGTVLVTAFVARAAPAQDRRTEFVFLVTADGIRHQELFSGVAPALVTEDAKESSGIENLEGVRRAYWSEDAVTRRERLMPFFWKELAPEPARVRSRRWIFLMKAVGRAVPIDGPKWNVLDMGCGIGLCGPLFRDVAAHLTGVDLSPRMVVKSREREVYDELRDRGFMEELETHRGKLDLILAADVFVYTGSLEAVFPACRRGSHRNRRLRLQHRSLCWRELRAPNERPVRSLSALHRNACSEERFQCRPSRRNRASQGVGRRARRARLRVATR